MSSTKLYTTPVVCKGKREWFVFFRYWDHTQNKYKDFKCAEGLNRIKDPKEKVAEFKALCDARTIWLKMGWNPLTDREFQNRHNQQKTNDLAHIKQWPLNKAIAYALEYKKLSVKSKYDYKKSKEYFLDAAKQVGFYMLPISQLTRVHIKAIFNYLQPKLSNKNYNKRLQHIKSLLSELIEWEALDFNPAHGIKELYEEETFKFIPLTNNERTLVRAYLQKVHPTFYVYCLTIYYTGIRPDEVLSLTIADVNFANNTIHLNPFSNVVKNKKERYKTMHPNLVQLYQQLNLQQFPNNTFVFSKNFMPGTTKIRRQVATELWKKLIWNELGIQKYLYSLKHLGADDLIDAGVSETEVQDHLGHSAIFITRRYTQKGFEQSKQKVLASNIEF